MKTKCYSVRLQSLTEISDKAYRAVSFDGRECIIPKSQVFCEDFEISKSEAYWISSWILEQKEIQYSKKKTAWYNSKTGQMELDVITIVEKITPETITPTDCPIDESLIR